MPEGEIHVSRGNTGWRVSIEGSRRASTHPTQADAWEAAKHIARRKQTEAILHGRDGRVREVYAREPRRGEA